LIALGEELILAMLGLREYSGVFRRLPKFGKQHIGLQILVPAKSASELPISRGGP